MLKLTHAVEASAVGLGWVGGGYSQGGQGKQGRTDDQGQCTGEDAESQEDA